MASPVGHAVVAWAFLSGSAGRSAAFAGCRRVAAAVVLGNLPDLDLLPGLVLGSWNRFHQGASHSLIAVIVLAAGAAAIASAAGWLGSPRALAGLTAGTGIIHLALDMVTKDPSPPIGIPLLWPFLDQRFHASFAFLPTFSKQTVEILFTTPSNLGVLAVETAMILPLAAAAFAIGRALRRGERHRP